MIQIDVSSLRGLDQHLAAESELKARLADLDAEAQGRPFNTDQRAEFEQIAAKDTGLLALVQGAIDELKVRQATLDAVLETGDAGKLEGPVQAQVFGAPNVRKSPENVFDLGAYRKRVSSIDELPAAYRDGAKRILDNAMFPTADKAKASAHIEKLLAKDDTGLIARRMIATSDPVYLEAWGRYVAGGMGAVPARMQAALQTYTDADGGYAIPFTIDPTFILTSNGAVNPLRDMARVETISTKEWQGVATAGVTATYAAETAAAADGAMSDVGNPTITPVRAHVFIPFTAEYAEDYGAQALTAELGVLIQDSKDVLEATKFVLGTGTGQPYGVVKALVDDTTSIVTTITDNTFALADVDKLIAAVPPRFRAQAQIMGNLAIFQLLPAFGTAGQPGNSIYDAYAKTLRGYPAKESTAMDAVTTDAKLVLLMGDFKKFMIVDRIGLSTEYIPQVFDGSGLPLGQRGVYARWRNSSNVLAVNAFRLLKIQ